MSCVEECDPALYWSQLHEERKKIVGKFNPHAKVMYFSWEEEHYPEWLCKTRVWVKSYELADADNGEPGMNECMRIRAASCAGGWEHTVWESAEIRRVIIDGCFTI